MKKITTIIKMKMKDEKLNVTEAAKKLGVRRPTLSCLVNGRSDLSVEMAVKLENLFGLNARALLIQQLDRDIKIAKAKYR